jgi:DNA (cytosine-5)-methyltransferase 1
MLKQNYKLLVLIKKMNFNFNIIIKMNNINYIELCVGSGGLSNGFINNNFNPLLLVDNNKHCINTLLLNNYNKDVVLLEDINNLCNNEKFTKYYTTENYNKIVDILANGSPCQSFSSIGSKKGLQDSRGNLLITFIDILKNIKPKIFLIENVVGLTTHNKGETLKYLIELYTQCGYNIYYKILNSKDYNSCQNRKRIFIIGINKYFSEIPFEFPQPLNTKVVLKDVIGDLQDIQMPGLQYNNTKIELYKNIPPGGCWKNLPIELQKQYMKKSFESGGGKTGCLRRLDSNKYSPTLLCSVIQKQTEFCHYKHIRPLSLLEYARIQGYPDNYKFSGSILQVYKQIGNSIDYQISNVITKSLYKYFQLIL